MKPCSNLHNQHGFTIVEMLIAMLIMTVGVIATLSLISTSMNANTHANRLTTKTSLAQQVVEGLLSASADSHPALKVSTANVDYQLFDPSDNTFKNVIKIDGAGTFHATYSTVVDIPVKRIVNGVLDISPVKNFTQIFITVATVPDDGLPLQISTYRCME